MEFSLDQLQDIEDAKILFLATIRPPPEVRKDLDIEVRTEGRSLVVYEIRPFFKTPTLKTDLPVAKGTYIQTTKQWKIFWKMSDDRWHTYEPLSEVPTADAFFNAVVDDSHHCFWG
ncbi:MAG: DUF3024 domain-containing protein [Fibrobacterales bacterium]